MQSYQRRWESFIIWNLLLEEKRWKAIPHPEGLSLRILSKLNQILKELKVILFRSIIILNSITYALLRKSFLNVMRGEVTENDFQPASSPKKPFQRTYFGHPSTIKSNPFLTYKTNRSHSNFSVILFILWIV